MEQNNDGYLLKSLMVFGFLTVALCFTAYQTAIGYETAIGRIPAIFLAVLCAGILGLLSLSLRSAVREGRRTFGIWVGCFVVAGVSFGGNFNAFYTGFIKGELVKKELEAKRNDLDGLYQAAETALSDKRFSEFERQANFLKGELRQQILSEGNPGLGPLARAEIKRIEDHIKDKLTFEVGLGNSKESLEKLANRYDQRIDAKVNAKRVSMVENAEERQKARTENKALYEPSIKRVDTALTLLAMDKSSASEREAISAIETAVQAYARIGSVTRSSLPKSIPFDYNKSQTLVSDKAGNIDHSFNTARENLSHMAVWLSAFLAFFIDMGVPLVIWLVQGKGDRSIAETVGGRGYRDGRPTVL